MRNKFVVAILTLFMSFVVFSLRVEAGERQGINYPMYIEDDADLLTGEEEEKLFDDMLPISEYGYVCLKTIDNNSTLTSWYARDFYNSKFGSESGTVFLIDIDNRNIWIFSDGWIYSKVTTGKASSITDNFYKLSTDEKYYECAKKSFGQILQVINGEKIAEPMKHISNALISVILALIINYFIVIKFSKAHSLTALEMARRGFAGFEMSTPTVVKTKTTKKYNPQSSSSGGSSGGGGGSSGGGGGHSF